MHTKTLTVIVEASTAEMVERLIGDLARVACDVSNSVDDEDASIIIAEAAEIKAW